MVETTCVLHQQWTLVLANHYPTIGQRPLVYCAGVLSELSSLAMDH
jgi:hypothetical protein